jgi:hypothetical protein
VRLEAKTAKAGASPGAAGARARHAVAPSAEARSSGGAAGAQKRRCRGGPARARTARRAARRSISRACKLLTRCSKAQGELQHGAVPTQHYSQAVEAK